MKEVFIIGDHVTVGLLGGPAMIVTSVDVMDGKLNSRCGWFDTPGIWHESWFANELLTKV